MPLSYILYYNKALALPISCITVNKSAILTTHSLFADEAEPATAEADENGNPIEGVSGRGGGNARYVNKQVLVDQTGASTSGMPSSSSQEATDKKKSKKKIKEQGKTIIVEDLPGYRGQLDLDDLVSYIETDKSKKKKVKNGPSGQTVQAAILPQQQRTPAPVDVNVKKVQPVVMVSKKKKSGKGYKDDTETNSDTGKDHTEIKSIVGENIKNKNKPQVRTITSVEKVKAWTEEEVMMGKRVDALSQSDSRMSSKPRSSIEQNVPHNNDLMACVKTLNSELPNVKDYIFTDYIVSQPAEEAFKVVSKKRDKKRSSLSRGREAGMFAWTHKPHSIDYCDSAVPHSHSARSVTPPPLPPTTVPAAYAGRDRAFSPSAFPSLGSSVVRGGRRNSTGNADPFEQEVDLSDVESFKSDSKVVACTTVSPVSYACIAAGGHKTKESTLETSRERRYSDGAADSYPAMEPADTNTSIAARTSSSSVDLHSSTAGRSQSTGFITSAAVATAAAKCASEPPLAHVSAPSSPLVQSSSAPDSSYKPKNNNKAAKPPSTNSSVIFLDQKFDNISLDISFVFESELATPPLASVAAIATAAPATIANYSLKLANSAPLNGLILPTPHTVPHGGLSFEAATGDEPSGPSIRDLVGEAPNPEVQVTDVAFPPLPSKEMTPPVADTHHPQQPPPRELDPNYQRGKFDLDRAVFFLFRGE